MTFYLRSHEAVIVLGGQIVRKQDRSIGMAPHTEMRARAAGLACKSGVTSRLIISGGHSVGVRYSLKDNTVFSEPNYSLLALISARLYPSEAKVVADFVHMNYRVQRSSMVLEEKSVNTEQNARNCARIVEKLSLTKTALLTSLYHMEKALACFMEEDLNLEPLYAEDLLILEDRTWILKVAEYYSHPRGGRQWDAERIRDNLERGKSIATGLT